MENPIIGGNEYVIGKLTAFEQLHVSRRLSPTLAGLMIVLSSKKASFSEVLDIGAGPLADAFANMAEGDVDYIVNKCLGACQRKQERGYAKVFANGNLMFGDIHLDTMIGLTLAVLQENLGGFFPTSQPT
jgi:hypothetical protein